MLDDRYKDLKDSNYKVFYLGLYGSQNYGLNTENSDVDCRALLVPDYEDCLLGKKLPKNDTWRYNDGLMTVEYDFRKFFNLLKKGNLNALELLYTEYWTCDPEYQAYVSYLRFMRNELANNNLYSVVMCVHGVVDSLYYKKYLKNKPLTVKDVVTVKRMRLFLDMLDLTRDFRTSFYNYATPEQLEEMKEYKQSSQTLEDVKHVFFREYTLYKDVYDRLDLNSFDKNRNYIIEEWLDRLCLEVLKKGEK